MTLSPMPPRWTFRPRPVVTAATLVFVALTLSLSRWQFERAAHKRALEARYEESAGLAPAELASVDFSAGAEGLRYLRVRARGRFDPPGAHFLVDNRVLRGVPGYWVVSPFRLEGAGAPAVLVARGWLPAGGDRSRLPAVPPPAPGVAGITGRLVPDSSDAIELSDRTVAGPVWQNVKVAEMSDALGFGLLPMVLVLDSPAGGLEPIGGRPDFKAANSVVYAWQWLSFALLAAGLYVGLNLRRRA